MPLFWLSLAFLGGIFFGEQLDWPKYFWWFLLLLSLLMTVLEQLGKRRFPKIGAGLKKLPDLSIPYPLILISFVCGALRFQLAQPVIDSGFISYYNDSEYEYNIQGVLVEPPDQRDSYTNLKVSVEELRRVGELAFIPVEGLVLARVLQNGNWQYGDRVRIEGELKTPPEQEQFSFREYLVRQGVYTFVPKASAQVLLHNQGNPVRRMIYRLRKQALETVYKLYPDPESSLLAGILLGVETGIPDHVQQAFNDTGTAHIIAISGFNITILSAFFVFVFIRLLGGQRRFLAAFITVFLIAVYTLLVGADAAVVRAAIMGGLAIMAAYFGRRQDGLNTLAIVAALMALFNPYVLWDVGFQLSFTATLGLLLYGGALSRGFYTFVSKHFSEETAKRLYKPVTEYILITFAAVLTTLPVIVYHFQRFSLVSLAANPAILPAQPPLMILNGLSVILGMLYEPLGQLAAWLSWPFAAYTIRVVEIFAKIPGGVFGLGQVTIYFVLIFYVLLLGWTFLGSRIKDFLHKKLEIQDINFVQLSTAVVIFLGILSVVVWRSVLAAPDGNLHITLMDVGSGDAILVKTPGGRNLLIDGGPSTARLSDSLGRRLPLMDRELDYLVVAAAGDGQIGGLPWAIERFLPNRVLWAGSTAGTYSARELRRILAEAQIPVVRAEIGQRLDLGQGIELQLLEVSSRGAVLRLVWGDFSALLPIGLDFDNMERLSGDQTLPPVTVLLLSESGYAPLNSRDWIERWHPQLILLSVAADDYNGLPDLETLQAVDGYKLLRTDLNGWVHISTDGKNMWVEVEKEPVQVD